MPIYEYRCEDCGELTEMLQRFDDPPLESCPECGGPVKKLISAPAFQFKGSGWYVTDYARSSGDGAGSSKAGASESGASESGAPGSEDSKSGASATRAGGSSATKGGKSAGGEGGSEAKTDAKGGKSAAATPV